jgi:hypothetical protein
MVTVRSSFVICVSPYVSAVQLMLGRIFSGRTVRTLDAAPREVACPVWRATFSTQLQSNKLLCSSMLQLSERLIESCEHCNEEGAEIPFDNILDRVTGSDPNVTDYILEEPRKEEFWVKPFGKLRQFPTLLR